MAQERPDQQENQPVWNSRIFRIGVYFVIGGAALGAIAGDWKLASVGVILIGVSAVWWKGKK